MSKETLSVIIPVYNTMQYLEECLESVIKQTYANLDIIIVNDRSPDESQKIIDSYCQKDRRIRSFQHEKNLGLGGARNTGIKEAKGKYLTFVDSDDWIEKDCYKKMIELMEKYEANLGIFSATNFDDKTLKTWRDPYFNVHFPSPSQIDSNNICEVNATAWNKIFLRKDVQDNEIYFPEHLKHEDEAFWFKYAAKVNPLAVACSKPYYQYRQREGSIMSQSSVSRKDMPSIYLDISLYLKKHGLLESYRHVILKHAPWLFGYMEVKKKYRRQFAKQMREVFNVNQFSFEELIKVNPLILVFYADDNSLREFLLNVLNDRWYRFGQLSRKEKIKKIVKVLLKKLKLI